MEGVLCVRWTPVDPNADKQHLPLVRRWRWCSDSGGVDQEAMARALGLLEALERPPFNPRASIGVAIR